MDTSFSHVTRRAHLAAMAADPLDALVIGGGLTGAGAARDLALRGFRVALVDRGDFGSATSSHSSRLIHGGLRYLEHGDFHLVFEASRERQTLLAIAPHLVRPLPFLFPSYRGTRVPWWKLRAGMWLYDALALFRNVRRHRWLGKRAVRRAEPMLRDRGLTGGALYYDAQVNDARLALASIRSAAQAGALVANYAEVTALSKPDGRVRGAELVDRLTGERSRLRALAVVNATGPWTDHLRRMDDPEAPPLLRLTKGAHVLVPRERLGQNHALTLISPLDGRVMFVLPWEHLSYIGTTDTDDDAPPDQVRATGDDVIYLVRSANAFFPQARLSPKDVVATWAGLRPLLKPPPDRAAAPGEVSREHRLVESTSGLITVAGGKLTTYRVMGRDVGDRVARRLHELDGRPIPPRPRTDRLPLPGGEVRDLDVLITEAARRGMPKATARHLVANYGTESAALINLADKDRSLARPLVRGRPDIWAQVAYAVEREMAVRLVDVLIRRTQLFYEDAAHAMSAVAEIAERMGELLGWDAGREAEELAEYVEQVTRVKGFLRELR